MENFTETLSEITKRQDEMEKKLITFLDELDNSIYKPEI